MNTETKSAAISRAIAESFETLDNINNQLKLIKLSLWSIDNSYRDDDIETYPKAGQNEHRRKELYATEANLIQRRGVLLEIIAELMASRGSLDDTDALTCRQLATEMASAHQ